MGEKTIKVKWLDETCDVCDKRVNSWDQRLSKSLGHKYIVCEDCLAEEYGMEKEAFRDHMANYYGMKPCEGI